MLQSEFIETADSRDYALCRQLHYRYGKTYYFATRFFPREIRLSVHALYGFVRCPDEWVDNPDGMNADTQRAKLDEWRKILRQSADGVRVEDPVMRAFGDTLRRHHIPLDLPLDFINAMEQDIDCARYETYQDLEAYMWGSASVIGVMMCYIIGVTDHSLHKPAASLGIAMQLTNFLRDVGEDWQRGRIYLPLEDLARFHISETQIAEGAIDQNFCELMRFEIARAQALYSEADIGIEQLPANSRFPIKLARQLYAKILDKIEANCYDVFTRRAHTTLREKLSDALITYRG